MSTEPRPWRIGDYEISGEEIADIVWLASFLEESRPDEAVGSGARADQNNLEAVSNAAASTTRNKVGKETSGQNKSKAPDEVTGAEGQQGRLYTAAPATSGGVRTAAGSPTLSGLSFPTPRAPGLSERPAFMRSLRPLLQRQPSRSRFEIDEDVTAERIANAMGQAWVPALRPLAERMFDLILLIEESPSMGVWRDTVRDLRVVLIQTGIFRDVNTWAMVLEETAADSDTRSVNMSLRVAQAVPGVARRIYEPGELIDPQQRRLILVLSDCCSPAWDNGTAMRLLKPLTTVNAVSIVQLLPEELWDITALTNAVQVTLFSRQIFTSNSQLEIQNLPKGVQSEQLTENPSIPVVTLAPRELNSWAHFVMGRRQERATGYYFHAHSPGDEPVGDIDVEAELNDLLGVSPGREGPTVDARYSHFLSTVPPRARRLAAHFAAAPLTIPIMAVRYADEHVIQYLADTQKGSSGSPVFNDKMHVIALHHAEVEITVDVNGVKESEWRNQGIRIQEVMEDLGASGIPFVRY